MKDKKFIRFGGRLRSEAVIKSALGGIAIGGAAAFIFATVAWFMEFSGAIIAFAVFGAVAVVSGVVLYFTMFRPTIVQNARRLDRYGLEERLITMVDLEDQDSYIAKKQREDALEALSKLDSKRVKLKVSTIIMIFALAMMVLFVEMTALEGLSEAGIVPSGAEVWVKIFPPDPLDKFTVEYIAEEGGYIIGETEQSITQGQDSQKVLAVAENGYMFLGWSDGESTPSRTDKAVNRNITVKAVFVEVSDDTDDEEDADEPDDAPGDDGQGEESLDSDSNSGDKYKEVNWVIDGQTYYRDEGVWDEYYEKMLKMLEEGQDIPEEYRFLIELYFNVIK